MLNEIITPEGEGLDYIYLNYQNKHFKILLNTIPCGIAAFDPEGNIFIILP